MTAVDTHIAAATAASLQHFGIIASNSWFPTVASFPFFRADSAPAQKVGYYGYYGDSAQNSMHRFGDSARQSLVQRSPRSCRTARQGN
jgi:hypothetical protein